MPEPTPDALRDAVARIAPIVDAGGVDPSAAIVEIHAIREAAEAEAGRPARAVPHARP
ncbi:hypothetical protein [Streptomyces sp. NPDC054834]